MMISRTWSSSHRSDLMAAQPPPHHQPAKKHASSSSVSVSVSVSVSASAPTSSSEKRVKATQSTLHDFPSFPVLKTWGFQRVLRCVKADDEDNNAASARVSAVEEEGEKNENKKKKKKKKKIKSTESEDEMDQILAMSRRKSKPPLIQEKQEPGSGEKEVPWNLRTRRGCHSRPTSRRNPNSEDEGMYAGCPMRRRSEEDSEDERSGRSKMKMKTKKTTKFSVVLTKQEIEEDLYSMTGKRASKRPKKRPRALKTQLDQLYPGIYMSEVTPALYEVREPTATPPE